MIKASKAFQELHDLRLRNIRAKYPTLPEHAIPRKKYSDKSANDLTRAIIDFIQFSGFQAERISTTGRYVEGKTFTDILGRKISTPGKWIPGSGTAGSADISATIRGKSVKIEVKIGRDRMSEAQHIYKNEVEKAGGFYFIAKDFSSFYNYYHSTLMAD